MSELSHYDYVLSLTNLKIERIKRIIKYHDEKCYSIKTTLTFKIEGDKSIYIAPAEICKKEVLVGYETHDESNKKCIVVPSEENDHIVIKLFFYKIWTDKEFINENLKEWLFDSFVGKQNDLSNKSTIDVIIKKEFKGKLYNLFFNAMWAPDDQKSGEAKKEFSSLLSTLTNTKITEKKIKQELGIKKPPEEFYDYFNENWYNFFIAFEKHFLQMVFLYKENIASKRFELSSTMDLHVKTSTKGFLSNHYYSNITLWLKPLLPSPKLPTFHFRIIPPEGVKFSFKIRDPDEKGKFLDINADTLMFEHSEEIDDIDYKLDKKDGKDKKDENKSCDKCISSLGINIIDNKTLRIKKEKIWNKNYDFEDHSVYFYYREKTRTTDNPLCPRKHKLSIKLMLERPLIYWIYLAFLLISVIIFVVGCYGLHLFIKLEKADIIKVISDSTLFVFGYAMGLIFDYTRRKGAERVILRRPLFLLLLSITALIIVILTSNFLNLLSLRG